MSLDRRNFLKKVGAAQAGAILSAGAARQTRKPADVVVIGAGAFGGWTAYYLRQLGASVRVVDAYGPGNSRATSGDETRGVRSSYGDRGPNAELWTTWANRAIDRWTTFDAEWGRQMKSRLFFNTGDLIFRSAPEAFTDRTQEIWKKLGIPFQVLKIDDVKKRVPVVRSDENRVRAVRPESGRRSRAPRMRGRGRSVPSVGRRNSDGLCRARRSKRRAVCRTSRPPDRPPR